MAQWVTSLVNTEPDLRKMLIVVQVPERFVSGESSALVNAINGRTSLPSGRKTRASESGVDNRPTLLSNAETFAQIALLATLGPEAFASTGTPDEPGTVLLSVGGSVSRPAVVEVPTGLPLGEVLDLCGATPEDGVLVGGYHGMWLPTETAYDVPVSRAGHGRRPAARWAPGSSCRSAPAPAPWARWPGSPATWPASRPASAARASSACPASPGRWPPWPTAPAGWTPWTPPAGPPPPSAAGARARTPTACSGSCCPRWTCSPRT